VVAYFETLNEARRKAALTDTLLSEFLSALANNSANVAIGVLLLVSAGAMRNGDFTVGDFTLFVSYLLWLQVVTSMVGYSSPATGRWAFRSTGSWVCCPAHRPSGWWFMGRCSCAALCRKYRSCPNPRSIAWPGWRRAVWDTATPVPTVDWTTST
jgi:hypothetical protein